MNYGDNNWVDMEMMPDKKSFMILTDSPNALLMDIKTLESPGRVKWEDDLSPISGISHPQTLNDGTMVSICSVLNKDRKPEYLLWKLTPEKPFFRQEIARIALNTNGYQHSFAYTQDYAIIFESPYYLDMKPKNLIMNTPINELFKYKANETTKIHVIKISDGTVTTLDAGRWVVAFHYGNSFQKDENTIVMQASTYSKEDKDPFSIFLNKKLVTHDQFTDQWSSNALTTFTLNLKDKTVKLEDIVVPDNGALDFP